MSIVKGVQSVQFIAEAPKDTGPGRWVWAPIPEVLPVPDWIQSSEELVRALHVYASTVARVLKIRDVCRFRLVAHDLATGCAVGVHEWTVSVETGKFIPADEPWVVWGNSGLCAA